VSFVVDASVAFMWFREEAESPLADAVLVAGPLVAPDLLLAEVGNACWKSVRRGEIEVADAAAIVRGLPAYLARLVGLGQLAERASAIAHEVGHPIYDCFYLALAERVDLPLVTADRRLVQRLARTSFEARVISLDRFETLAGGSPP
jgi:predicted nucleic acid-binding protein